VTKEHPKAPKIPWRAPAGLVLACLFIVLSTCARDYSRHAGGGANAVTVDTVSPEMGPNTSEVTITIRGTNFGGSMEVYLGSTLCTGASLISNNILTTVIPSAVAAGTYDITIISSQNGTGSKAQAYTVVDPTALELTGINPQSGVNDVDTAVTITGDSFVAPLSASIGETEMLSVEVVDIATVNAVVPAGLDPGFFDVSVTNPDGTTATLIEAFEVIDAEAIRIDSVDPTAASNEDDVDLMLIGANFEAPRPCPPAFPRAFMM